MIALPEHKQLVLFDGVCNLCNSSIQFIIKHDKNDKFRFAPLQGIIGQQIINTYKIDTTTVDSILLYSKKDGVKSKSTAVLKIASQFRFPLSILGIFLICPAVIRNWVYDYIAKHRYKWFGKKDQCMIPTHDLKAKFLD